MREEEWHLIVRVRQPLHGHGHGHGHGAVGGGSRMAPTHETISLGVFTEHHRIAEGSAGWLVDCKWRLKTETKRR